MNEVWKDIFKDWISCYDSIRTLYKNGVMDDEDCALYHHQLLNDIIETCRPELEE